MNSDVQRIVAETFNKFVKKLSDAEDDSARVHEVRQYSNKGFFYCRQLAVSCHFFSVCRYLCASSIDKKR